LVFDIFNTQEFKSSSGIDHEYEYEFELYDDGNNPVVAWTDKTFHSDITDSLYSMAWTPSSPAGYFGTWLFLFFLGVIARALIAGKAELERHWLHKFSSINVIVSKNDELEVVSRVRVSHTWRTSVDLPRALIQLVIQGVYYLLYILSCKSWK